MVALAVAEVFGVGVTQALNAIAQVRSVAGRYTHVERHGCDLRLLLAKNPAGWLEALDVLVPAPVPVTLAVNAQVPDGRDTSWLWDVDYRRLRGRPVLVTGERRIDLAVRLEADEVAFRLVGGIDEAIDAGRQPVHGSDRQLHGVPADPHGARADRLSTAGGGAMEYRVTARGRFRGPSAVRLVWVYPDLLSTYGDRGNLLVLARRARLRGIPVEIAEVNSDQRVPRTATSTCWAAARTCRRSWLRGGCGPVAGWPRRHRGAVVFAVCAGYQIVGTEFGGVEGEPLPGLGLIDVRSGRGERRGVGEITADVDPVLGVQRLTGFENHQGLTRRGP